MTDISIFQPQSDKIKIETTVIREYLKYLNFYRQTEFHLIIFFFMGEGLTLISYFTSLLNLRSIISVCINLKLKMILLLIIEGLYFFKYITRLILWSTGK